MTEHPEIRDAIQSKNCLYNIFIMDVIKNGQNEDFKYYTDTLPTDLSEFPEFCSQEELELMAGSPLRSKIETTLQIKKHDFDLLARSVPGFEQFTFEEYLRAGILIQSRIASIYKDDKPTNVIMPYFDMLNHQNPVNTNCRFNKAENGMEIVAFGMIKQGHEVFNTYGENGDAHIFLIHYGFYDPTQKIKIDLDLSLSESSKFYDLKLKILKDEKPK